ncbi:hypothetical protein LNTAR_15042 [Lentisphaera araneosa HTCC2155]|uniref:Uncharacterized protein n=1 Tax=Lentisphaera araneosa HTCC2155 TaxID=313628 RepID=A6DRD3_9BACT|nr:hypothetical protein [Lentisphaera araneosa]EDM25743.1 hypothetical protein LNTAR_15042 [Lentisphaera araneosa HTCC2155]
MLKKNEEGKVYMNEYYIVDDLGTFALRKRLPGKYPNMIPNPHRYIYPKFESLEEFQQAYAAAMAKPVVKLAEQVWM